MKEIMGNMVMQKIVIAVSAALIGAGFRYVINKITYRFRRNKIKAYYNQYNTEIPSYLDEYHYSGNIWSDIKDIVKKHDCETSLQKSIDNSRIDDIKEDIFDIISYTFQRKTNNIIHSSCCSVFTFENNSEDILYDLELIGFPSVNNGYKTRSSDIYYELYIYDEMKEWGEVNKEIKLGDIKSSHSLKIKIWHRDFHNMSNNKFTHNKGYIKPKKKNKTVEEFVNDNIKYFFRIFIFLFLLIFILDVFFV